ncbi:MAG: Transposase IS116/IS110/IS902, partial [uncultured Caballeronia sp.]
MKDDSTLYVGLDVHKKSITIAYAIDMADVELYGKIAPTRANVDRLLERLRSKAHHLRVVYEAGPYGYGLYRQLIAHRRWLSSCSFPNAWQQFAFEEHRRSIEDRLAQCERLETALHEAVADWRFYPVVPALQAMRGVQFIAAVGMTAGLGDLSRFARPSQLMAWLGITPSEHSSGDKRRQGSITKAGNSFARKLLVEAAWSYRYPARIGPLIQQRQERLPQQIIDRAWDAQLRLCRRFQKFVAPGKNVNIAV